MVRAEATGSRRAEKEASLPRPGVLYALAHALVGEPVSTSPAHALTAGEIRNAPLGHGFHALLEIVGLAQPALLGELVLGRLGDAVGKPRTQRRARREYAERRVLRDLGRERERRGAHLILRNEHVGEAHRVGIRAGDPAAR